MADDIAVLRAIYSCFNARDIDGVLDALTDDVAWANGMEGRLRPRPRGRPRVLDAPVGHRQPARRAPKLRQGPGWIDRRRGQPVREGSARQAAARLNPRAQGPHGRSHFPLTR